MLEITTPPDPRSGSTVRLLDPLDWIHAVTAHIPDRGSHCVRYYGALANRARARQGFGKQRSSSAPSGGTGSAEGASEFARQRRASWARLIRKIFELDPLLCPCGAEMKIVSFITQPRTVDRILRHLRNSVSKTNLSSEARPPPLATDLPT